jgi:hypothetical protein
LTLAELREKLARKQPSFQFYAGFGRPKPKSDNERANLALRDARALRNTALPRADVAVVRLVLPWVRSETCAWGIFKWRDPAAETVRAGQYDVLT